MFKVASKQILSKLGVKLVRREALYPVECDSNEIELLRTIRAQGLSMVGDEGLVATLMACNQVVSAKIDGDFVECGVWRGGCAMIAAATFKRKASHKSTWLFDTYAGMTAPTEVDVNVIGMSANTTFEKSQRDGHNDWCYASIEDVSNNFKQAGLLDQNVRLVKGDVMQTLAKPELPERISVLRLDTDWYESTRFELEVLYPRLSIGGVLIVDDYGHWGGARKAVDEYFSSRPKPFLQMVDSSARMAVKIG